ncbi:MAG TPA: hypothetical protein VI942_00990 [Thermoanaerobaculia bacterium]|nr:hypothetical protein [Thermoanaerobaculia bacterium]
MPFDVCVCYGARDSELGSKVTAALDAAGVRCTVPGQGSAPDPSRLGVPETDFGGARIGLVLVTREWTAAGGLRAVMELADRTGTRLVLVWWDEDAPSDFAGSRRPDESIFYACYLPHQERIPALVEKVRAELAENAPA